MKTRSIDTFHHESVCDVCGRTLLRGENTEGFLTGGRRFEVCELCKPRAIHEGWMREGTIPDYPSADASPQRRGGLFGRLRSRSGADRSTTKKRGRETLDDELEGDGWNPHAPLPEPDFHDPNVHAADIARRVEHAQFEEPAERQAAPRTPSTYHDSSGDSPPPRRPSRRGMPPHTTQPPVQAGTREPLADDRAGRGPEPRPLRFAPADEPEVWEDQPVSDAGAAAEDYEGGAIEAWETEDEHGWLDRPVDGEAELFDDQHADSWPDVDPTDAAPDRTEDPHQDEYDREPHDQLPGRSVRGQRAPVPPSEQPGKRSRFRRQRGERRGRQPEQDSGLRQPSEPRQVHAIPSDAIHKSAAAVSAFNDSEHCRTIAGVARSLGAPVVNVTPDPAHAGSVWIVASWELCWYRYEVDISSSRASVRLDTQGYELSELTDAQQVANAVASASGQVTLA
jgi:hypothetical protein